MFGLNSSNNGFFYENRKNMNLGRNFRASKINLNAVVVISRDHSKGVWDRFWCYFFCCCVALWPLAAKLFSCFDLLVVLLLRTEHHV